GGRGCLKEAGIERNRPLPEAPRPSSAHSAAGSHLGWVSAAAAAALPPRSLPRIGAESFGEDCPLLPVEQPPETMHGEEPSEQSSPQRNQEGLSTCSKCGKSFTYRAFLLIHRKLHTGSGSHLCFLCGNSFPGVWSFAKHLRSHPGLRPYKCEECGERFAKGSHLGAHRRTHQGRKRSQECRKWWEKRLCFSLKPELLQHLQIYTGEKLYKCGQCEGFARNAALAPRGSSPGNKVLQC
ncbi:hypothetical protein E2320_014393, partial [Naja naja]